MSKRNVVHVEIPALNVEGAGKFYESLFGWKITHMPEMNYTMWEAGDRSGGASLEFQPKTQPGKC
jgi:predicted enzyme related to lactoylglutathione lyase